MRLLNDVINIIIQLSTDSVLWSFCHTCHYYNKYIKEKILRVNIRGYIVHRKISQTQVVNDFVISRNFAGLKICRSFGFSFGKAIETAITHGDLHMVKYLFSQGVLWETTPDNLPFHLDENGMMRIMIWCKNKIYFDDIWNNLSKSVFKFAVKNRYYKLLIWIGNNGRFCPRSNGLCESLDIKGNLELVKWMVDPQNGISRFINSDILYNAVSNQDMDIYNWLIQNGYQYDIFLLFSAAIKAGNIEILDFCIKNGYHIAKASIIEISHGNLKSLSYFHNLSGIIDNVTIKESIMYGYIDVLDWMKNIFGINNFPEISDEIIVCGGINVINWCIENKIKKISTGNIKCESLETLIFIINEGWYLSKDSLSTIFRTAVEKKIFVICVYLIEKNLVDWNLVCSDDLVNNCIKCRRIDVIHLIPKSIRIKNSRNGLAMLIYKNFEMFKSFTADIWDGDLYFESIKYGVDTGNLEILQYCVNKSHELPRKKKIDKIKISLSSIIKGRGRMKMVNWVIENEQLILSGHETQVAVDCNDMKMFYYAIKMGGHVTNDTFVKAIEMKNIEVLALCSKHKIDSYYVFDQLISAIRTGNIAIVQIVLKMIKKISDTITWQKYSDKYAARYGNLELLKLLYSEGMIISVYAIKESVIKYDLEMFVWLTNIINPDCNIALAAAAYGSIPMLKICLEKILDIPFRIKKEIIHYAIINDRNDVIKYLYDAFVYIIFDSRMMSAAINRNNFELLSWIKEKKENQLSTKIRQIDINRLDSFY